jgi:hypothetical protein
MTTIPDTFPGLVAFFIVIGVLFYYVGIPSIKRDIKYTKRFFKWLYNWLKKLIIMIKSKIDSIYMRK